MKSIFHYECCLCGFSEVLPALEFHHVIPEDKGYTISGHTTQTKSLESQLDELRKCILVCANCHRGIHYGIYTVPNNWQSFYDENVATALLDSQNHKKYFCSKCGKELTYKAKMCRECRSISMRVVDRPNREILKQEIRNTSFLELSKKYNVSDNAIRKWCTVYGLPKKKRDINSITDEDWEKI